MNTNKNARPLLEQVTGQENNFPKSNNITDKTKAQHIYDLLPQGESNAVPSRDLVELTGSKSVRELQSKIANERDEGFLILSTCRGHGGYFRPDDGEQGKSEINAFIQTLEARAKHTFTALRSAKKALAELDGQCTLDNLGGE